MKEWKLRQHIFHQFHQGQTLGDELEKEIIVEEWEPATVIKRALDYPKIQTKELYYPGKSYAVAVTFALLLKKHFGTDLYEALNDDKLLYGNDPYYRPYFESPEIYDAIISNFPVEAIELPKGCSDNFKKTCEYFEREFLLHDDTAALLPS